MCESTELFLEMLDISPFNNIFIIYNNEEIFFMDQLKNNKEQHNQILLFSNRGYKNFRLLGDITRRFNLNIPHGYQLRNSPDGILPLSSYFSHFQFRGPVSDFSSIREELVEFIYQLNEFSPWEEPEYQER